MITCIIAEKPSVARDIAHIVGANNRQDGFLEGNGYMVTWAMGHLITLAMPEAYGFATYKAEDLPIRPNPFQAYRASSAQGQGLHVRPHSTQTAQSYP